MSLNSALARMPDKRNVYDFLTRCNASNFTVQELNEALIRYGKDPHRYLSKIDKLQALTDCFRPESPKKEWPRRFSFE